MPGEMAGQGKGPETKAPVSTGGSGAPGLFLGAEVAGVCRYVCRLWVDFATQGHGLLRLPPPWHPTGETPAWVTHDILKQQSPEQPQSLINS